MNLVAVKRATLEFGRLALAKVGHNPMGVNPHLPLAFRTWHWLYSLHKHHIDQRWEVPR